VSPEAAVGHESFETRLALVCEDAPERRAVIKAALEQIGFTMLAVKNADDAIERMRRDVYELVILDEQYQGSTALDNPVLASIRAMAMTQRRWTFVALVGREFKTFDNAMAFARSVNVVVNVNDLPHFPAILKKGITEHVEFYRTFRQVLTDAGKR
jgi:CheY-like chemotaxis protein